MSPRTRPAGGTPPAPAPAGPRRRVPKQARARERVGRILDAARRELEVRAVADITIEGIAERAGVPVGSVYQYFSSKVALLAAVAETVMAEADAEFAHALLETRKLPWREVVDRVTEAHYAFLRDRPDYRGVLRSIRYTAEFGAVTAASNERVADLMALHPGFGRAGYSHDKARRICRTAITAVNALQDLALAEEDPEIEELIEETKRLAKGYLGTYLP